MGKETSTACLKNSKLRFQHFIPAGWHQQQTAHHNSETHWKLAVQIQLRCLHPGLCMKASTCLVLGVNLTL